MTGQDKNKINEIWLESNSVFSHFSLPLGFQNTCLKNRQEKEGNFYKFTLPEVQKNSDSYESMIILAILKSEDTIPF